MTRTLHEDQGYVRGKVSELHGQDRAQGRPLFFSTAMERLALLRAYSLSNRWTYSVPSFHNSHNEGHDRVLLTAVRGVALLLSERAETVLVADGRTSVGIDDGLLQDKVGGDCTFVG